MPREEVPRDEIPKALIGWKIETVSLGDDGDYITLMLDNGATVYGDAPTIYRDVPEASREERTSMEYMPEGTRVRLTRDVERYPHFIAEAGETGTVTQNDEMFNVRLDSHLPGAEEWDNEVQWSVIDHDQDPSGDVEVLPWHEDPARAKITVTYDVTELDTEQRGHLAMYATVQAEGGNEGEYPSVRVHVGGDTEAEQRERDPFHTWAVATEEHAGCRIEVASDGSLDEAATIRTIADGPSVLSAGVEYFLNLDAEAAEALDEALVVATETGDGPEILANVHARVRQIREYQRTGPQRWQDVTPTELS